MKKRGRLSRAETISKKEPLSEKLDIRARKSREKVLLATTELLYERGLSGASVDEVSRRSGVAKTTIYRHWPTRTDLMKDACLQIGTAVQAPETGRVADDIREYLMTIARILRKEKWTSVLPSVIDAAERDPDIAAMYSELQAGYSRPLEEVIRRGIRSGQLPPTTNPSLLISLLTGPLFFRRWFSREPLNETFVERLVEMVLKKG